MRFLLLFIVLFNFTPKSINAQEDSLSIKHYIGMQFVGQSFVSFHYNYSFFRTRYFFMTTDFGLGINEYADDSDPENHPGIYSMYHGINTFSGFKCIFAEVSILPTTYFSKYTYMTLNGWFGLAYVPPGRNIIFSVGYTPIMYPALSKVYPDHFNGTFGFKFIGNILYR